jgi:O-methyltransferase involved in polyketide biosynthesis
MFHRTRKKTPEDLRSHLPAGPMLRASTRDRMARSYGHCATMETASMTAIADAMGLTLACRYRTFDDVVTEEVRRGRSIILPGRETAEPR